MFTTTPFTLVTPEDIEWLKARARLAPRKRMRLCVHRDLSDPVHEMVIVQPKGAYVRPHKHVGKEESFHLIEGAVTVVLFGDDEAVRDVIPMGTLASGKPFYYRMPADVYHTVLIDSEMLVYHEAAAGPFRKADLVPAPWAPTEEDAPAVKAFLDRLRATIEDKLVCARRGGGGDG